MVSSSEGSEDRIEVLRRKIAALELLAGNPGTTVAESESAQSAANKMRLELAKLVREAASRPAPSSDSSPGGPERAPEAGAWEAEAPPREATDAAEMTPTPTRRGRISIRSAPAWTWQIPSLGIIALVGASFWLLRSEPSTPKPNADDTASAAMSAPAPEGSAERERERERNAILARIQKSGGSGAVAEAMRACRIRDLVKEFQSTSGALVRPGEEPVDVRRRCGAYLTVRGFDDAMCFPATTGNPHPICPIPE